MTATNSKNGKSAPPNVAELRNEIAETRAQLGETVEALSAKADVKARAKESAEQAKARAKESAEHAVVVARESAQQAAVSAAQFGRDLKADPAGQLRITVDRLRQSVNDHPAPWAVAVGALVLAILVAARKGQR